LQDAKDAENRIPRWILLFKTLPSNMTADTSWSKATQDTANVILNGEQRSQRGKKRPIVIQLDQIYIWGRAGKQNW